MNQVEIFFLISEILAHADTFPWSIDFGISFESTSTLLLNTSFKELINQPDSGTCMLTIALSLSLGFSQFQA